jgi:hypothetical protein
MHSVFLVKSGVTSAAGAQLTGACALLHSCHPWVREEIDVGARWVGRPTPAVKDASTRRRGRGADARGRRQGCAGGCACAAENRGDLDILLGGGILCAGPTRCYKC